MDIYLSKLVIEYCNNYDSPVYACFLDASKVFDKINPWTKNSDKDQISTLVIRTTLQHKNSKLFV